jgi:integrase
VSLMPQPWKHPKLGTYYFRKVVPEPLRATLGRTEIRIPLIAEGATQATKNAAQAKLLYADADAAARADAMIAAAKGDAIRLTHQQVVALAGEWFRRELKEREAEPGDFDSIDHELDDMERAEERGHAATYVAFDVDELLQREALSVDEQTRAALAERIFWHKVRMLNALKDRARGSYVQPEALKDAPTWQPPKPSKPDEAPITVRAIVEQWKNEKKPGAKTAYSWPRIIKKLTDFVGHEDAARITDSDIIGWKDALLASGLGQKTIENHLIIARTLFGYAHANKRIPTNPAAGVKFKPKVDPTKKKRGFNDEEAARVLTAARNETEAHKRWAPWLCAFSGARIDEICGAMAKDVERIDRVPCLHIRLDHREAGASLKNEGSERVVPLHSAVIAEGFLDYVKTLPKNGPLFPSVTPDMFGKRGGNGSKTIGRWVRETVGITSLTSAFRRTTAGAIASRRSRPSTASGLT